MKLRPGWRESLNPDYSVVLERLDKHLWRPGAKDRTVPQRAKIHGSVTQRIKNLGEGYRPCNLLECYIEVE